MSRTSMVAWIDYVDHRGAQRWHCIRPGHIYWGSSTWHARKQFLLRAFDVNALCYEDFAMANIKAWSQNEPVPCQDEIKG